MHICIFGDSWGVGEWERDPVTKEHVNTHKGLEQYLLDKGHNVTNISLPGTSIDRTCNKLIVTLLSVKSFDLCFWFKTDPMRNYKVPLEGYEEYFSSKGKMTFEDIIADKDKQSDLSYNRLNELGITIHCIGGLSKLNIELMSKYKNLVPYIPSMIEFLIPEYEHPILCPTAWYKHFKYKQFELECLDKMLACEKAFDRLREEYPNLFWPDGNHPNRYGHQLLFEKICKDFNL